MLNAGTSHQRGKSGTANFSAHFRETPISYWRLTVAIKTTCNLSTMFSNYVSPPKFSVLLFTTNGHPLIVRRPFNAFSSTTDFFLSCL